MGERVAVGELAVHRARKLICWPECDEETLKARIVELEGFGVSAIVLAGRHRLDGLRVLGKGHTGVVVEVESDVSRAALKVLRIDSDRHSMGEEARLLSAANAVGVGPRLFRHSRDFLLMELVEGPYLRDVLDEMEPGELRRILRELLRQARRLDVAGVDHGEMVSLRRHVILRGDSPVIIDFESASTGRRVANVTTTAQSLFIGGEVGMKINRVLGLTDENEMLKALRNYRRSMDEVDFRKVLETAGLG